MSTSANYIVVSDALAQLDSTTNPNVVFTFTGDPAIPRASKPILVWKVNRIDVTGASLEYEILLNGDVIHQDTTSKNEDSKRSVHEIFPASKLEDGTNRLQFRFSSTSGPGQLKIADIYLLYQQ